MSTAEPVGPLFEQSKLDKRITVHARIWSVAGEITVNKRPDNRFLETLAHIGHMMRYSQTFCQCGSSLNGLEACIACDKSETFYPEAPFKKHTAHRCAVNASAHSHKNTLFCKHN